MDGSIEVTVGHLGSVPVVTVNGEIDVTSAPVLRDALAGPSTTESPHIVVDLRGVTFLDSTALGVLVGAHKQCRERGGELGLAISEPRILKIFEITGLTDVFTITPTPESAAVGSSGAD
jgi:anti-sigma B factor antagonist